MYKCINFKFIAICFLIFNRMNRRETVTCHVSSFLVITAFVCKAILDRTTTLQDGLKLKSAYEVSKIYKHVDLKQLAYSCNAIL